MNNVEFIDSSAEQIIQKDLLKHIELCGRVCYKSEDKITEDSAKKFIENLVKRGHTSVLEHGTIYLKIPTNLCNIEDVYDRKILTKIFWSPYSVKENVRDSESDIKYVTTNLRVVVEASYNDLEIALNIIKKYGDSDDSKYVKRVTFRIICDRGVSHELVRHRVFSFSQESTRYVNSTKRGFLFIKPYWWNEDLLSMPIVDIENINELKKHNIFIYSCKSDAENYSTLIELGQTPQQARAVLPSAIKTEVMVTGTIPQWEEFLKLRLNKAAHPDMSKIALMISNNLKEILTEDTITVERINSIIDNYLNK